MRTWKLAVLWVPIIAGACDDTSVLPTQTPKAATTTRLAVPDSLPSQLIWAERQDPPDEAPPEYRQPTTITVKALVGFMGQTAWGQSFVSYGATNVTASVDLVSRNTAGTVVASNSGSAQDAFFLPQLGSITASTSSYVPDACGTYAQATARGSVWMSLLSSSLSFLTWGNKSDADANSAVQPACPPPPQQPACSASSLREPRFDCGSTGGGDMSPPPSSSPPASEPQPYYPIYYEPKRWTEVCYTVYPGTDYERIECYRQESNDAKLPGTISPLAEFRGVRDTPAFGGGGDLPSVFLVVSDAVPAGSMAVVHRNREGRFKNVIVVPSAKLRPAELVRAMLYLYDSRSTRGETPSKSSSAQLKGPIADADVSAASRDNAATFTALLASAKQSDVGQYGTHPMLEIRMGTARTR